MYFLGLDEPSSMPGDARVDFFYRPTYIGAAIIIRAALLYPDLLEAKAGSAKEDTPEGAADIRHVLPRLLTGCTGRGFTGHGYESLQGLIETLTLFTKAGTAEFVEKYPDLCRTFQTCISPPWNPSDRASKKIRCTAAGAKTIRKKGWN